MRFFKKFDLTIFLCIISFLMALALIVYLLFFHDENKNELPLFDYIKHSALNDQSYAG